MSPDHSPKYTNFLLVRLPQYCMSLIDDNFAKIHLPHWQIDLLQMVGQTVVRPVNKLNWHLQYWKYVYMHKWTGWYFVHYSDLIMSFMSSQITSLMIVYSAVYSGADQRKHQSSESLAFVWGIHQWPVNSLHKWPVTWKMFPFDLVSILFWICTLKYHRLLYITARNSHYFI